jgi:COP9 signalosome complex subunit 5
MDSTSTSTSTSATMARQRWELENQIVTTDDSITTAPASSPDQIYWYDEAANARAQQEKAWTTDHNYFKRVKVTTYTCFFPFTSL